MKNMCYIVQTPKALEVSSGLCWDPPFSVQSFLEMQYIQDLGRFAQTPDGTFDTQVPNQIELLTSHGS